MSIQKLPSGRWRAQVYSPLEHKNVSVSKVLPGELGTYRTKTEAKSARERARAAVHKQHQATSVHAFRERWLSDPLFRRPKQSTMLHNAERTRAFTARYGSLPIDRVGDEIVAEWLADGNAGTVPALRAMFNDAASAKAGRLVAVNPFARLGIRKTRGLRDATPPEEKTVWQLVRAARKHGGPSFAAWLQVASFTGMRPGELDALRWDRIDLETGRIHVVEQFSAATKTFTAPKNGKPREAILTPPARAALLAAPRESETFCFTNLRRGHWTSSARAYHWKATRATVDFTGSLYLATRHFAGWYMVNVLELPSEDVAIALGHTDGGDLVRKLYGHRDTELALRRVANAYAARGNVRPLKTREKESA